MSSEKPNFLSQPVVKNIFMFRNGDPYYEARRIVINQKRVSNFETLLREVTGGIQAPFGAVRNIYTPRGGHKVDCLESLQSGEQYVAAGRERFKKMDYLQIGSRRRRLLQTLPVQAKPLPQNRIVVSARFLKPIKEPCTIFVVANGDVLNPALRLLIHQRMLGQFDRILEMITERMGLRVLGGVRSLYTYEGHQVTDGNLLESGQLYVAVGREKFKKLSYSDLLFTKPRGTRRVNGMKANSLPPIYRFSKQNGNGNSKSTVPSSDSGGGDSKASLQGHSRNNKEHLSSIVREISQARLISLRKKRSGQSMTLTISDNDDQDSKGDDGITDGKTPQDQPAEPAEEGVKAEEEKHEKAREQEETAADNTKEEEEEEEASSSKADEEEQQETNSDKENGEEKREGETTKEEKESEVTEKKESEVQNNEKEGEPTEENENTEQHNKQEEEVTEKREDEEANDDKDSEEPAGAEEKDGEEIKEVKEVMHENKEEVKSEEQGSSSSTVDKSEDSKEKEDGSHTSSEGEKDERGKSTDEEKQDKDSEKKEKSSKELNNDVDTGEEQTVTENSNDPGKTQPDNETKDNDNDRSNSSNSNQEEEGRKTREGATKESGEEEGEENGEVGGEDDEVESEAEPDTEGKKSTEVKDTAAKEEKGEGGDEESGDNRKRED